MNFFFFLNRFYVNIYNVVAERRMLSKGVYRPGAEGATDSRLLPWIKRSIVNDKPFLLFKPVKLDTIR